MTQQRFTHFRACPCDDTSPSVMGPCSNEQEAREYAQELASEYGETMRLFMGPEGAVLPELMESRMRSKLVQRGVEAPPIEMTFVCYVEPAKASGNEPWAIFVSNHVTIQDKPIIHSHELDAQDLRFWLLYWDEVGICDNNVEPREFSQIEQSLHDRGILNRWATNWACDVEGRELIEDSFLLAFMRICRSEPGKWSAGIEGRSICYPPLKKRLVNRQTGEELSGVLVKLNQSIPVPAADVPLDDVLEFHLRRKDEVSAFRAQMDTIYRSVMAVDTASFNAVVECQSLGRSLTDLGHVARESSIKFLKGGFEARLKTSVPKLNFVDHGCGLSIFNAPLRAGEVKIVTRIDAGLRNPSIPNRPYTYIPVVHPELSWA